MRIDSLVRLVPERPLRAVPWWCALLALACAATSEEAQQRRAGADEPLTPQPATNAGGSGATGGSSSAPSPPSGSLTPDPAPSAPGSSTCASTRAEAEVISTPVDIIVLMDNSGSMSDEARAVEANINVNFASILDDAAIDYRVILLSQHRQRNGLLQDTNVCINSPLSGLSACPADKPAVGARFFPYSVEISSHNSLQKLIDTYDGSAPDDFGLAPSGWSEWLRPGAKKVFLEISDDDSNLDAQGFLSELSALDSTAFGTPGSPAFAWHSIIGLAEKSAPLEAYSPTDPIVDVECSGNGNGVASPGQVYQELSQRTGGLRFPICQFQSYDTVFRAIADDVVSVSAIACDFALPVPPNGQSVQLDKIAVSYTPGDGGAPLVFGQAPDAGACQAGAFVIDGGGIRLCPEACDVVRSDTNARVDVLFTCESTLILR